MRVVEGHRAEINKDALGTGLITLFRSLFHLHSSLSLSVSLSLGFTFDVYKASSL